MSESASGEYSQTDQLIESETRLVYAKPPAGPQHESKQRGPLPSALDDWRLAQAIRLMERNPASPVRLEEVAQHVDLSPFHFQRYFKDAMGESPAAYLRRVRLDRAALNLCMGDDPVLNVALRAGYASHEAFIRAFHRQFGLVPTQYRVYARQASSVAEPGDIERARQVRVRERPAAVLLGMRFYGPYANVEMHWQHFAKTLEKTGIALKGLQAVGIIQDNPEITANEFIRYDCAIVDPKVDVGRSALTRLDITAGTYVSLEHRAPYSEIFTTFRTLSFAWLPTVAAEFVADANGGYEFYQQPPWERTGAVQHLEVVLPLRKTAS